MIYVLIIVYVCVRALGEFSRSYKNNPLCFQSVIILKTISS